MSFLQQTYRKLAQSSYDLPFFVLLLIVEAALSILIVLRVPYTEIDWVAYMQEVTSYQNGERNYINIRGDTGPLVYPAGFLYLYEWFKSLATWGNAKQTKDPLGLDGSTSAQAIRRIQWVFVLLYMLNATVVLALYQKVLNNRVRQRQFTSPLIVWSWRFGMGITCLSKRIHSIFVLRLFNDAPAMMLLHLSMLLFSENAFSLGCVFFSVAVSIKMNVLLFAPGLLLLLLQKNQSLLETIKHLSICASIQILLGWPFLSKYPVGYISKAFEFDRVFFFKWTVNWKFLPEELFVSKSWALILLVSNLATLSFLARKWWKTSIKHRGETATKECLRWQSKSGKKLQLSPEYILYTMFVSNYIGVMFARTLHYQFYCWYFYSLPFLHWMSADNMSCSTSVSKTVINLFASVMAIVGVEYAFNVFPATNLSSFILQVSHLFLLVKIFVSAVPQITVNGSDERKQQ